jgi:hypothetical protein
LLETPRMGVAMSNLPIIAFFAVLAACGVVSAQSPSGPVAAPDVNPRTAPTKSIRPTNQSAEEIVVKEKLNAAGVTSVRDLVRNPDGSWKGRGVKDKNDVAVVVDTDGNIKLH